MMCEKLGLFDERGGDEKLINDLLSWMHKNKVDFTNLFRSLMENGSLSGGVFQDRAFVSWHKRWELRLIQNKKSKELSLGLMRKNNPVIIPRNHRVEEVLRASVDCGNFAPMYSLIDALKKPYDDQHINTAYQSPPKDGERVYKTFCGT